MTSARLKLTTESRRDGSLSRRYWRGPADPLVVAQARRAVTAFAADHVSASHLDDIVLCVSEAMTNAVTHGVRDSGTVTLAVAFEANALTVVVTDDGHGFRSDSPHAGLGLGLPLIAALADRSAVSEAVDAGTSVTMRFALRE